MGKDKKFMQMVCEKCGKEMPIDKEKSNEIWCVYEMKCPCGGSGKVKLLTNK